ncbi:glutathione S-transferase family protein [Acinetobacter sp. Ver3]|uniref:glutathione S-transferase family protein n=1 Tax=Acinetobacter sp. Ver3 TaxID=466088 RepID=UPI00044CC469|nr:glutathione S-transferase [Acinetobacter sp. Ver3]EZQ01706.1 glutathione S-transferase [Acinetobacter sp. Ver3]
MLTLHHLEKSRSSRIIWALEELGTEYQIQHYKRLPTYAAPPELKKVHPLGKSPVITDDNLVIAESAVILDYLADRYDTQHQFKPQSQPDLTQYQYWMHYAEGSLMPLLVMTLVLSFVPPKVPFVIRPIANKIIDGVTDGFIQPRLAEHIEFLEQHLAQHEFFISQFSFADIQMSFPLIAMDERLNGKYPNIHAYVKRIKQRPAYQRAVIKGGD